MNRNMHDCINTGHVHQNSLGTLPDGNVSVSADHL